MTSRISRVNSHLSRLWVSNVSRDSRGHARVRSMLNELNPDRQSTPKYSNCITVAQKQDEQSDARRRQLVTSIKIRCELDVKPNIKPKISEKLEVRLQPRAAQTTIEYTAKSTYVTDSSKGPQMHIHMGNLPLMGPVPTNITLLRPHKTEQSAVTNYAKGIRRAKQSNPIIGPPTRKYPRETARLPVPVHVGSHVSTRAV